jgi:hypothetical protein
LPEAFSPSPDRKEMNYPFPGIPIGWGHAPTLIFYIRVFQILGIAYGPHHPKTRKRPLLFGSGPGAQVPGGYAQRIEG